MKLVFKIARNELRNLFYSPVAWFLTFLFLLMCGYLYANTLYPWARQTAMVLENDPEWSVKATLSITFGLLSDPEGGFFSAMLGQLYLFVPLLTMSVISREINNGTIKLLYSSPVKLRQIVLGKYLAIMIYNLFFIAILGFFVVAAFFDIRALDYGPLLSAMLGIYLLLCALTAIGFFMSSLTTYPIVSAIASFLTLFVLSYVGQLWQEYDFVRDITYFLSINNRVNKMIGGLITTKDIAYYLVIIFLFVGFTLLKLRSGLESRPWYVGVARYLTVIVAGLMIGYITSRPAFIGYWDVSRDENNTVHPRTQKILKGMDQGPLEVTLYTNLLGITAESGLPRKRNEYLNSFWQQYQRFKRNIEFKYVYYYDYDALSQDSGIFKTYPGKSLEQIVGLVCKLKHVDSAMFLSPDKMRQIKDLSKENYQLIMELKYNGRSELLRTSFDGGSWGGEWPAEALVDAALKRVTGSRMPKVFFVTGQLERNIFKKGEREYLDHTSSKTFSASLVNIGFDVDTLNLQTQALPANADIIVLADPKMELSDTVQQKLRSYIDGGGNMFILGEPGKQYVLNPVLQNLDIQFMNGQLVQLRENETAEKVLFNLTPSSYDMAEEWWLMFYKHLRNHNQPSALFNVSLPGITALSVKPDSRFKVTPMFVTLGENVWQKAGPLVADSVAPVFNAQEGDIRQKEFPFAAMLTRKVNNKEQRVIVAGDADFASNRKLILENVRGCYSWLCYNEYPIYTPKPYAKDNMVILSPERAAIQKIVYVWVLPGLLLLGGTILLTRRKRR